MVKSPSPAALVRFGVFELDLSTGELRKNGRKVKLQEQAFQVLAALLERPGEVVTREDLQRKLWPDDTFVDFEAGLFTTVNKIRRALGDSAATPRYVETLPRRGYRFIAPVDSGAAGVGQGQRPKAGRPLVLLGAAGLVVILLGAGALLRPRQPPPRAPFESVPLTSYPGREINPEFSPDGNQVAFAWDGGEGGNFDIYVKTVGPGEPVRLTKSPENDFGPAWSPDGRFIAFSRGDLGEPNLDVMVIPALGGRDRKMTESSHISQYWRYVTWMPDSRWLIVTEPTSTKGQEAGLVLVSTTTGEQRRLTSPSLGAAAPTIDIHPSVSPDGHWVAFTRSASTTTNIFKIPLSDGSGPADPAERLTPNSGAFRFQPVWSRSGDTIIYNDVYGSGGPSGLWRVGAAGDRPPEPLHIPGIYGAVSRGARRLVYQRRQRNRNIWELELAGPGRAKGKPRKLIASTYNDHHPEHSPDGTRIVFTSLRSGSSEIWIANSDGSRPFQLTNFAGPQTGTPRWSPDGSTILFSSMAAANKEAFLIDPDGGQPKRITDHAANDAMPSWASDGKGFYIRSNRSGQVEMWKIPLEGDEAVQITRGGAITGFESADGKWLYPGFPL